MNGNATVKNLLGDCRNFLLLSLFLLLGDGLLCLILLLFLHAWELEAALYLFRGTYLATGALGLLIGAVLLISSRYQQKAVQGRWYAAHFRCFPFLLVLLGCSAVLVLVGGFFDYLVRGL